jgi:ankyrin repeat protein
MGFTEKYLDVFLEELDYDMSTFTIYKDLHFRNHAGRTVAMMTTSVVVVKTLLDYGIDINAADYLGRTALMRACQLQNYALMELYLQAGANVNQADRAGVSPLHLLIQAMSSSTVEEPMTQLELMLEYGCDCDQGDRQGKTLLLIAAAMKSVPWIKALLPNVRNLHALDQKGYNALTYAIENVEFTNRNSRYFDQARLDRAEMIITLLKERGIEDVNVPDRVEATAWKDN